MNDYLENLNNDLNHLKDKNLKVKVS